MGELDRIAAGQHLHVDLPGPCEGVRAANESEHAAVRRERRLDGGVGEVRGLHPFVARRRGRRSRFRPPAKPAAAASTMTPRAIAATQASSGAWVGRRAAGGGRGQLARSESSLSSSSASLISSMCCARRSRSLRRQREMIFSSSAGRFGARSPSGGGSFCRIAESVDDFGCAFKWPAAGDHFVENRAKRKNIGTRIHLPAFGLLG